MLSRLEARLQRLEQQRQGTNTALAQGLSGLRVYARAHHSEAVPIADLTDADLVAKIPVLAGAGGTAVSTLSRETCHTAGRSARRAIAHRE
jgi:hypothetical protein